MTAGSIEVTTGYRGRRTDEAWIAPGVYAADDPALHGQASFLIDSGRARWLTRPAALPDVPPQESFPPPPVVPVPDPVADAEEAAVLAADEPPPPPVAPVPPPNKRDKK